MSEMGSHDPFRFFKHELWPKERPRVQLPIWLPTIKSRELPWFPCVQVACHILLESSWRGLQLCFKLHLDRRSKKKLWASKFVGVLILGISGLQLGSPGRKWHLGVGPLAKNRGYYKGEGGGFSQVWAVVSFVSSCLPMVRPCTKNAPIML